jgi:hypothetical protein
VSFSRLSAVGSVPPDSRGVFTRYSSDETASNNVTGFLRVSQPEKLVVLQKFLSSSK